VVNGFVKVQKGRGWDLAVVELRENQVHDMGCRYYSYPGVRRSCLSTWKMLAAKLQTGENRWDPHG
jgi:hypothetical protein